MVTSSLTLYLLLLTAQGSFQKSSPASPTYRAAVVELGSVFYNNDSAKTLNDNAEKIMGFVRQAAEKDVDIIVFPELVLPSLTFVERARLSSRATLIPDPSQNYKPCTNSSVAVHESLKKIACAVEQNSLYVVVSVLEKEICSSGSDCPSDGIFYYIASVVFDREGKIIARYRKGHLLADYDLIGIPKISTFDTDFGVTFGNIICFDIMYEEPLLTLTRKLNVTDIIHPAAWYNEMPFRSTIQMISGFAYAEDVNILSSGHHRIRTGHSGSGIYAGRQGVVAAILPLGHHEEMVVADVLKKSRKTVTTPNSPSTHDHHFGIGNYDHDQHDVHTELLWGPNSDGFGWRYEDINSYTTKIILADGFTVEKLKYSDMECEFRVNVTHLSPRETYRLVAYDGRFLCIGDFFIGIKICAIVQCADDTIGSCGHFRNSSSTFDSISITTMNADNSRTLLMPNSLGSDLWPLDDWTFEQQKRENSIITTMSTTEPTQNLLTFGIWGRNFEMDTTN